MLKPYTFRDWRENHPIRWDYLWRIRWDHYDMGWRHYGWKLWQGLSTEGYLSDLWYYIKCRVWRRYHVLRCPYLAPTYHDRAYDFIYFMFQLLVDEVEQDGWFQGRAYYCPPDEEGYGEWDGRDEWQEVAILYDWWMNVRPARELAKDQYLDRWHTEFQQLGGMTFGPVEGGTRRVIFPEERGQDTTKAKQLSDAYHDFEKFCDDQDEAMMHRLVAVVPILWT